MSKRIDTHCHTRYSNIRLIDAIPKPEQLIDYAIEIGLAGIAITDHECLSAHIKANKYAQEVVKNNPDFKVILGNEIYLVDERPSDKHYHYILLAKDAEGHKILRMLSTLAWLNSYNAKGLERVDTLKTDLERFVKANPGHLVASTACIGGELGKSILNMTAAEKIGDINTVNIEHNNIVNFILWNKELFGNDFYLEVQPGISKEQVIVNRRMLSISKAFNIKMIATSDAHYLKKDDRYVHKAFLNSKEGDREVDAFYQDAYLHTNEEMIEKFKVSDYDELFVEQMFENSIEIYNKIENYNLYYPQQIPHVEVKSYPCRDNLSKEELDKDKYPTLVRMFNSPDKIERYWVNECIKKLHDIDKYNEEYLSRLEEEADIKSVISEKLNTNFFAYPVVLQHYVDLFWECGSPVGAGRGSSCSGLNHYLLGVTQLDPIEYNLPFWRYSNKERIELGDIDIDIAPSKRPKIINAIKKERGANFLPELDDIFKENLGAVMVATFGTETSKSAILTACRGYRSKEYPDGIDNDTAQYLSSLVPIDRGFVWDLHTVVYGDESKGRKPISAFINEVELYPGLLDIMFGIEGLISRRGSHASGLIMLDEDPFQFGCYMRTPSGEVITQYDLHDAEYAGMTKYDFLVTSVQDKIAEAIRLLQEDEEIEKDLSLRQVYNKYFHPSVLPMDDEKTWKAIQNVEVLDLFQFDSTIGSQAAKKIKPANIFELSDANGLMRLMTAEKGAEMPMDKYVRYKNNISLWYEEMDRCDLTKEEQEILKPHFLRSYGVPPSQEQMMTMLMDENICNFSLKEANDARKIVGKKQMSKIPELKEKVLTKAKRIELGKYIWTYGIGPQMGYSFSIIHALAYSFIGYQCAYIATKWNPIYWNTACLIVNSGSLENDELDLDNGDKKKDKGADYAKIAKAIGAINSKGINVSLININTSDYSFKPDVKNNRILYGLKALSGINSETIEKIIAGRPYKGIKDFMNRCSLNKTAMITLIKSGAFDEIDKHFNHNRFEIMAYYLMQNCDAKKRITLQNFKMLIEKNLIPQELELQIRVFNFNTFLKNNAKYNDLFIIESNSENFIKKYLSEVLEDLLVIDGTTYIKQTVWKKWYDYYMDPARDWAKENQSEVLEKLNTSLFLTQWNKYAGNNLSAWEMDSLCFYHSEHELAKVDNNKYGIRDFNELPIEPEVDYYFKRGGHNIPIYKLCRVAGTVIAKNDSHSTVTILTTTGVVDVKFSREYYAMFKKQVSEVQSDGTKKVIEKSWFKRGTKIMVTGFRRDDQFIGKVYSNTEGHQLYKITDVIGYSIKLQHERKTSGKTIEEDYDE